MKAPPRRKGNSHPKLARNHAAETGTTREPRGRPTQKVYPNQPIHAQTSVTSQNTTRATRHIYVTYQVLAHKQRPPPNPLVEHPAGAFAYKTFRRSSRIHAARFRSVRRRLLRFAEQALTSQRGQTRHRTEILLLVTTGQHLLSKHLVKRHTRRHNRQVLVVQAVGQHHKT